MMMSMISVAKGFLASPQTRARAAARISIASNNNQLFHLQLESTKNFPLARRWIQTRLFSTHGDEIENQIKAKGDEIRQLKADGIDKQALAPHIEELLSLKAQLPVEGVINVKALGAKIKAKGDEIRKLKEDGIEKSDLAPHIEELLALKAQLPAEEKPEPPKKKPKKQPAKKSPAANAANKKPEEMSEKELRYTRLAKVDAMREAGVEPFEYTYQPTHTATELASLYEGKLEGGEEDVGADVAVAGRIMTRRVFGKQLAFFTLQDESGTIQLQFDKKRLGETFKVRPNISVMSSARRCSY